MYKDMTFTEKYFKVKRELKSRKWKKDQLEKYILEMSAEKVKVETILKLVEVVTIPLTLTFLSFVLSLFQFKVFIIILSVSIFIILELIILFSVIRKCYNNIYQIGAIISLATEIYKKK